MKSGIYKIENLNNGKVYVGSAINIKNRWSTHSANLRHNKHINIPLQNSYNKHGEKNFKFSILENCDKEQLIKREQYWMNSLDVINKGYNIRPNAESNLGFKHSEKFKQEMSKRIKGENHHMFGKHHTKKTKEKLSIAGMGRIHTEEVKLKISNSLTGIKRPYMKDKMLGKNNIAKRPDVRKKISEKCKGRIPWNKDKNHPKYKVYIEKVTTIGKTRTGINNPNHLSKKIGGLQ